MGYLICDSCRGYYKLKSGEYSTDFTDKCACGGTLRFSNIIDGVEKDEPRELIENEITLNTNSKTIFDRINETEPIGSRARNKEISLMPELYEFDYIEKPIDNNILKIIMEILADNLFNGMGLMDIVKDIVSKTSLSHNDAVHITRNEVHRIRVLGKWYISKKKGFKAFSVDSTDDVCERCVEFYKNKIFLIDDIEMLPPLHDLCMCLPFFRPTV